MDIKNLTYDFLGLTLRLKVPGFWRQEQEGAEYQLKIEEREEEREDEERKVSYIQWRYGDRLEQIVTARPHPSVQTLRELGRREETGDKSHKPSSQDNLKRLRKDYRVINNYLSPEQITHIETWLEDQPDHFLAEELDGQEDVKERNMFTEIVQRNRNVQYRKVSIV